MRRPSTTTQGALLLAAGILSACAINQPVALPPEPTAVADFLAARHSRVILVVDSTGLAQMVHSPRLDGDTLRGLRSPYLPRHPLSIPLASVKGFAVPKFSAERTLDLAGGILAVTAILILLSKRPPDVVGPGVR